MSKLQKDARREVKPPPPPKGVEFFFDVPQGGEDWHNLRCGIPTAGSFASILATPKDSEAGGMRATYLRIKAGEILTGEAHRGYKSADMERGLDMEPAARAYYERTHLVDLVQCGFVRRKLPSGRYVGASPDSFIGDHRRILEIKTLQPDLLIELAERGTFPSKHRAQLLGTMWISGADEAVLLNFYDAEELPKPIFRMGRDEARIREIAEQVEVFDYDLHKLVEKMRNMKR